MKMNRSNTKPGVRDSSGRYLRGPGINSLSRFTRKRPIRFGLPSSDPSQHSINIQIPSKFLLKRAFSEADPHESIKIQASMKSTRIVLSMQRSESKNRPCFFAMSESPTNTNGQQSEKLKTPFCSLEKAEIFCKLLMVKKSPACGAEKHN